MENISLKNLEEFLTLQEIDYRKELNSVRLDYFNEKNEISIEMSRECVYMKIFDEMKYKSYPKLIINEVFEGAGFEYIKPNVFLTSIRYPLLTIDQLFSNISKQIQSFAKLKSIALKNLEEFDENPLEFFRRRNQDPPRVYSWHLNKKDAFIEINKDTYSKIYKKEAPYTFREFFVFLKDLKLGVVKAEIIMRNGSPNEYEIMESKEYDLREKDIYEHLEDLCNEYSASLKLVN